MKKFKFAVLAAAVSAQPVLACDLCSVYSATESRGEIGKGFVAGLAEQFTHFSTWQQDGKEIPNEHDESFDSSIVQILVGYNFTERFGVQFTAPLIHRWFQRVDGHDMDRGEETGLGDVSLLAHVQAYRRETANMTLAWNILGGIKFPTGNTGRLKEETEHEHTGEGGHEHPSGVHGHDLTLGSGSYDGIAGTSLYARWKRMFVSASVQYAIRSRGEFDYEFANDLIWAGGPGMLLVVTDPFTLSLQANVSGETKGRDKFRGETVDDTGITAVYLGPEIIAAWQEQFSVELGLDVPVHLANTGLQIVPDYRAHAAVTWHF
jgi:hypothetical protein